MIGYLPDEHSAKPPHSCSRCNGFSQTNPRTTAASEETRTFARGGMRAERARCATLTCNEAEAIFEAVSPLIAWSATEAEKKHAIKLAIQAARLPHGERGDTIRTLLAIAPQVARANLVLNLILSGETIPFSVVQAGINDVFEDAKKHTWILDDGWKLKAWLLLLPFTDDPAQLADTIAALPRRQREPHFLEEMIRAAKSVQTPELEEALFHSLKRIRPSTPIAFGVTRFSVAAH